MLEATYRAEQRHFWFRGFRRFVYPLLCRATAGMEKPRLLDCGCGTGANLALLSQFGSAFGIDLTWRGLQFARAHGRTRVAQAGADALPVASSSMDVAVSFDVFVCLPDAVERRAIEEMHRVLRPGGAIVVNAAALDILYGDHSVFVSELRRYSCSSLRSRLERVGFRIERITYTNACLFPVAAVVRAVQRLRGVREEGGERGDFYVPPAPVNACLAAALAVEARAIAAGVDMPFGSSVLCLARKV